MDTGARAERLHGWTPRASAKRGLLQACYAKRTGRAGLADLGVAACATKALKHRYHRAIEDGEDPPFAGFTFWNPDRSGQVAVDLPHIAAYGGRLVRDVGIYTMGSVTDEQIDALIESFIEQIELVIPA